MTIVKMTAILLIVAGIFGLAYRGFTYTKETQEAVIGPLELTIKDQETVNIPTWAGVVVIALGSGLLLFAGRKS